MKYTKEEAAFYKNKYMEGLTNNISLMAEVTIKDGFYIVESKINKKY